MRAFGLVLLTLHVASVAAQDQPLFRASTRLVQVSVVVEDRDGRPISGLTAKDFRLFDEGQEQRIELFLTDAVAPGVAAPKAAAPSATPAIHAFSNRLTSRSSATFAAALERMSQNMTAHFTGLRSESTAAHRSSSPIAMELPSFRNGISFMRFGVIAQGRRALSASRIASGSPSNSAV